jgi:hypothetical protein
MSRKTDLERHIRESYELIREYQAITQVSDDPREKRRSQRAIDEQWTLIKSWLEEYLSLCQHLNLTIPTDIQEIATFFPEQANLLQPSILSSSISETVASLERQLSLARQTLATYEEQAAQYGLDVPSSLQVGLTGQREKVVTLERQLSALKASDVSETTSLPDLASLHRAITSHFDREELRTLCFELRVDYDNLRGEGKAAKARELVSYLQRQGQLDKLVAYLRQARPGSL